MAAVKLTMAAYAVLIALVLYDRWGALRTFYYNAPSRLVEVKNPAYTFAHKFVNEVRNCEDIVLNEKEQYAIVSCDPGRDTWNTVMGTFVDPVPTVDSRSASAGTGLYLLDYLKGKLSKLQLLDFKADERDFHPLGVEIGPHDMLYVLNHAFSGTRLEIFKLYAKDNSATHIRTIEHPLLSTPNSIQILGDNELLISNDHTLRVRYHPILAKLETIAGLPTGTIAHVKLDDKFDLLDVKTVARLPFPNGIARLNVTTIAVASSNTACVRLYTVQKKDGEIELHHTKTINVPFLPDNLSADSAGVLLITGHPNSYSLEHVAKHSRFCTPAIQQQNATQAQWCKENVRPYYLSWIAEWTEGTGLNTIYSSRDDFGATTTAVRDLAAGIGISTGLYEQGLLHFQAK